MKKAIIHLLSVALIMVACSKVPISGRRQVNLMPESDLIAMSLTQYGGFLKENKVVPKNNADAAMLQRVGNNISHSVEKYLKKHGQAKRFEGFKWEFNLVNDPIVNAWCMPGGKVVFYTGILPITQNETGIAVVMGHEIAHAIARHGNERMSQSMIMAAGGTTINVLTSQKPETARALFITAYGLGSTLGSLAYSRKHESEADKMGLVFMAMAGYNPMEAPKFWQRMSAQGGQKPPQLLSTHPSDASRIRELNTFMPQALKYYKEK
jgi:predicted Zn-dependent protease